MVGRPRQTGQERSELPRVFRRSVNTNFEDGRFAELYDRVLGGRVLSGLERPVWEIGTRAQREGI